MDAALRRQRTVQIGAQTGLSDRTLRRWVAAYQAAGLPGLRPAARPATAPAAIAPVVLDLALTPRGTSGGQNRPGTPRRGRLSRRVVRLPAEAQRARPLAAIRKWVHYGYTQVIDLDVASYFDTVPHD